ncbi:hypothetical protein FPV67DRAFT_1510088 [Lyophyllum atratum]|nr:hypothetical protein FPV67DRAFT_1510088 [Lyophyllum atratum]
MSDHLRRIPLELLGEIFQFYVGLEGLEALSASSAVREPSLTSKLSSSASPLILGRVCWTWRKLSLAMPSLWSLLAVYRPRLSQLEAIQIWLERSGDRPLFLDIFQPPVDNDEQNEALEDLLLLLADHGRQWKHFSLNLCGAPPPEALYRLPFDSFAILDSVDLRLQEDASFIHAWRPFYAVPTLRRVSWDFPYVEWGLPKIAPWSQLTHVQLPCVRNQNMSVDELLQVIMYCVELVDLELAMTMPLKAPSLPASRVAYSNQLALASLRAQRRDQAAKERASGAVGLGRLMVLDSDIQTALRAPIDLPNLRFLKIHAHGRDAAPLLDRLKLPALISLHILHYITFSVPPSTGYITELLQRSGVYKLDTLSIYDPDLAEGEILELLESPRLRFLRQLELLLSSVTDDTIEVLTHAPGMPCHLPHLKDLTLPDCVTSDGVLSKMVLSRQPMLSTMKFSVAGDTPLIQDVASLRMLSRQSTFCLSVI